jgi:hypothetical protein
MELFGKLLTDAPSMLLLWRNVLMLSEMQQMLREHFERWCTCKNWKAMIQLFDFLTLFELRMTEIFILSLIVSIIFDITVQLLYSL